jgi:hypothetical protein
MGRLGIGAACAFAVAAATQQPAANDRPDPVAMVSQAEKLLAKKEVEDAILLLWRALDELATRPSNPVHDATTLSARFLLQENDPREPERRRVFTAVGKQQLELAAAYRLKKWFEVAATRIDVAERYDRDAAAKERALLVAARPKVQPGTKPAVLAASPKPESVLRRDNAEFVAGDWKDIENGIEVTARAASATAMTEWVTRTEHADHEIVVEWKPADPKAAHDAALQIGMSILPGSQNYSGVRFHCMYDVGSGQYAVVVATLVAMTQTEIASAWVAPPPAEAGWTRFAVRVRDAELEVVFGAQTVLTTKAPGPVRGKIGLVTGVRDRPSCAMKFRNLRVEPLPADAPSDEELRAKAEAETQNAITNAVDAAKDLLAKKQPEAAALSLRDALAHVDDLPAGVLRDNLRKSIEATLTQADPLTPRRVKAAQTIAAELAGLADQYAAAGLVRAALVLAEHAAAFDPAAQAPRVAATREKVQQWNLAQATARAAELQPPTDDGTVLREWFAKGRKLDTSSQAMVVEGAVARVDALAPGSLVAWLPFPLAAKLTKASVHVRLPGTSTGSGLCVDAVDQTNFTTVTLVRRPSGLRLGVWRFVGKNWIAVSGRDIPMDAWRLDAWHPLVVESTEAGGIVARCGDVELKVARSMLGKATGLFGLCVENGRSEAVTMELRAFQPGK